MAYQLKKLACYELKLTDDELRDRIEQLLCNAPQKLPRWAYFCDPMRIGAVSPMNRDERPYRQAQEWGLPSRITGVRSGATAKWREVVDGVARKEVVIENDIAWRIETMVDYLFGKADRHRLRGAAIERRRCDHRRAAPRRSSRTTAGSCCSSRSRCSGACMALSMCW